MITLIGRHRGRHRGHSRRRSRHRSGGHSSGHSSGRHSSGHSSGHHSSGHSSGHHSSGHHSSGHSSGHSGGHSGGRPKPVVCPPPRPPPPPKTEAPCLGIIRLDYDYPANPGDIDHPDSFPYDVYYKVVPGFTFEMCQSGVMTPAVKERFKDAIKWLIQEKKVKAITGDCGFMFYFQKLARHVTSIPVFMSSLCVLPAVTCSYAHDEQIMIMTANGKSLAPMRDLIRDECGVDTQEERYHIIGCEDVDGFEAVAEGGKVDYNKTEPGVVKKALDSLKKYPRTKAILLECTELPQFADSIRRATNLPVHDAITASNFFMAGYLDDERFGMNDWQEEWDGEQEDYSYGDNLTDEEKDQLVNKL